MFPANLINPPNPYFKYELDKLRWFRDPARLRLYTLGAIVLGISLAVLFHIWSKVATSEADLRTVYLTLTPFSLIAGSGGIVADLYYAITPMLNMNRAVTSGQWDLLRLTPIGESDLVLSKYAFILTRVWGIFLVLLVATLAATGVANQSLAPSQVTTATPLYEVVLLFGIGVTGIGLFFRMRALTAYGLWVGAQVRTVSNGYLAVFFGFLVLLILNTVVSILIQGGLLLPILMTEVREPTPSNSLDTYFVMQAVAAIITTLLISMVYWCIQRIAIANTIRLTRASGM
jgi:hypothetical protein